MCPQEVTQSAGDHASWNVGKYLKSPPPLFFVNLKKKKKKKKCNMLKGRWDMRFEMLVELIKLKGQYWLWNKVASELAS
jgi:hypothetical protein